MLPASLLGRASSFAPSVRYGFLSGAKRQIANLPYHSQVPSPPPREYNPDGSPKVYRLNQISYDHNYDWERWSFLPVGVFHTAYRGVFARDSRPLQAFLLQYHTAVIAVPIFLLITFTTFAVCSVGTYGIRPKRFTIEWMEASKERDRAENSNPCTRYLDRRRKERGPNWIVEDFLPTHPFFVNMGRFHSDTEYGKWKASMEREE
ncbi:Cg8 family protein [Toxoplasma gondii TgCatPRC2]|uniref:Cg8 family protein n=15 Tax=Toxoplasma gondii TaxID=5811 RepID=B9PLQ5_TOXGV|nr:Cg8 family protein [Toxoplasma gondii ME49]EPR62616.1 Cg8 family protein [Toxoplasma gondii GT1]ESS31893.1 Cg8 family protein [Toxoplasma gondii VEG]KAF4641029.1 Cg8 family protein [Toxoplasma gondii]KFG35112.1 Cg8 family protein [Toxoplasma gondii p89]KFG49643.1 Cg8 family protein [Toxoplasma gondii GAB2-2007-GAL-DOM2]KFG52658.1 Cg8 family protein [Toxoplasma gondii FOU]KFG65500.1 Cg8 family protein [Toxoplasma gondii RUB]KFH07732.1 Cg8 family protein [Toxoplasma gondii MAS]KFH10402.1 |eukprot:XP_002365364.1 Cg8 family protein [Toxoplasma gondii ME49]